MTTIVKSSKSAASQIAVKHVANQTKQQVILYT